MASSFIGLRSPSDIRLRASIFVPPTAAIVPGSSQASCSDTEKDARPALRGQGREHASDLLYKRVQEKRLRVKKKTCPKACQRPSRSRTRPSERRPLVLWSQTGGNAKSPEIAVFWQKEKDQVFPYLVLWWRWGELNSRPKAFQQQLLRAQTVLCIPSP